MVTHSSIIQLGQKVTPVCAQKSETFLLDARLSAFHYYANQTSDLRDALIISQLSTVCARKRCSAWDARNNQKKNAREMLEEGNEAKKKSKKKHQIPHCLFLCFYSVHHFIHRGPLHYLPPPLWLFKMMLSEVITKLFVLEALYHRAVRGNSLRTFGWARSPTV